MINLSRRSAASKGRYVREQDFAVAIEILRDGQISKAIHILQRASQQQRFYPLLAMVQREEFSDNLETVLRVYTGTTRQKWITKQLRDSGLVVVTDTNLRSRGILQGLAKTNPIYEWQLTASASAGSFVSHLTDKDISNLRSVIRDTPEHQIWGWTNILVWTNLRSMAPQARTGGVRIVCNRQTKVTGVARTSFTLQDVTIHPFIEGILVGGSTKKKAIDLQGLTQLPHRRTVMINAQDEIVHGYSLRH
jgi:hypothetical protein